MRRLTPDFLDGLRRVREGRSRMDADKLAAVADVTAPPLAFTGQTYAKIPKPPVAQPDPTVAIAIAAEWLGVRPEEIATVSH